MTRRSKRRLVLAAILLAIAGAPTAQIAWTHVSDRPYVWSPVPAVVTIAGRSCSDRVYARERSFLLDLSGTRRNGWLTVDPATGSISDLGANPLRLFGRVRTATPEGVVLTDHGKAETFARLRTSERGFTITLSPDTSTPGPDRPVERIGVDLGDF